MNEPAILLIWLIGLFGLIGAVMAAVVRLVRKDSIEYDKRFTWRTGREWDSKNDFKHKT
ncbi:hypothetical protein ACFPVX_19665 [Cohnella faecalis]|uniref:hypothetical protein n=1 Tax=Cohnella faecalis TaxID=2315694 RepID=UPI0018F5A73B|nr:hypothetical protein [Cohnella faecalis]